VKRGRKATDLNNKMAELPKEEAFGMLGLSFSRCILAVRKYAGQIALCLTMRAISKPWQQDVLRVSEA
jgi:hypothetical protein